jgi:hypothetical protein
MLRYEIVCIFANTNNIFKIQQIEHDTISQLSTIVSHTHTVIQHSPSQVSERLSVVLYSNRRFT